MRSSPRPRSRRRSRGSLAKTFTDDELRILRESQRVVADVLHGSSNDLHLLAALCRREETTQARREVIAGLLERKALLLADMAMTLQGRGSQASELLKGRKR